VRLVAPDGSQIGVRSLEEAQWLSQQLGLDLVEVAPDAKPPVCRLMDYGKFKYEQSVRQREARKKQTRTVIKEVKFRPKIDEHDFNFKRKNVERFLAEGNKIKSVVIFRGREIVHSEIGREILNRLASELGDGVLIESPPRQEGNTMVQILSPKKTEAAPKPKPAKKAPATAGEPAPAQKTE
jgi:translation initiation factor IF-3